MRSPAQRPSPPGRLIIDKLTGLTNSPCTASTEALRLTGPVRDAISVVLADVEQVTHFVAHNVGQGLARIEPQEN